MRAVARCLLVIVFTISLSLSEETEETRQLKISIDNVTPRANDYVCASVSLPDDEQYIVKFQPEVTTKVHHLLLFSCEEPYSRKSHWSCKSMGGICARSSQQIVYAWANHADGLELPEGVGFKLGAEVNVKSLVLQLHYGNWKEPGLADTSALSLSVTKKHPPKVAGMYILIGDGEIPAKSSGFSIEGSCTYRDQAITPFAYRVHAHSHSTQITGYYRKKGGVQWLKLGSRSPQDPQAFYPIQTQVTVHRGDVLGARCQYVTSGKHDIFMGPDTSDEMCNFYIMYHTANTNAKMFDSDCLMDGDSVSGVPLPPVGAALAPHSPKDDKGLHAEDSKGEEQHDTTPPPLELASDWFLNGLEGDATRRLLSVGLGQVSGVAVDGSGDVYILHRGSRVWGPNSFDESRNVFRHKEEGPIPEPVLLHLSSTGQLLHKMGANMFYLPHGLTVDNEGNIWITDVAMHQVFKFRPNSLSKPVLTLGVAFRPGTDHRHFCKPSAVAVATDGSFFVADGYCNSRIIQFSKSGEVLQVMDHSVKSTAQSQLKSLFIPHSLTLLDGGAKLMVADRENGRLITMATAKLSHVVSVIENFTALGSRLFAVAAPATTPGATTPYVFVVNQKEWFFSRPARGFTVDLKSHNIVQRWSPELGFGQPHDVATSSDGEAVYVAEIGPNRVWKFSRHKPNSAMQQARNRSIGFDASYPNTTSQDDTTPILSDSSDSDSGDSNVTDSDIESTGTVRVQDETNMPNSKWDKNLHDDKDNTTKDYNCPSSVPPCRNRTNSSTPAAPVVPDENGFLTTPVPATTNATDVPTCPMSLSPVECIKLMALHTLPALLLGVCFAIVLAGMVGVAVCLTCRGRGRCCNGKRMRRDLSKKAKQAKSNMHSLLGPSHQGFVKVKTFDSDSEEEDVIFQQF